MVETKKLSEPSQDRSPDTPTQEQFDNTFRSQTPVASTPENTQSTTAPTPKQEVPTPQPTLPQKTAPQPAQVQEQPKPVVPKSVTWQPVFVERQLQMDLDKYVTDEELLQGIVSKDITKNHLNYLKATDPDKYSKAVKFLSSQDAKVRAQRIRDNMVANDVDQAEVVEPPTYQSELQKLQEQATSFYKFLIDETDKASTTFSAQDLYNQTVNTEELSAKREEANKIASELEELQLERNKIRQQVEDQYWDDVPQAVIEAEIAKRARSFTDREMLLQSRYRTALADYQGAEQDAQTQFKLALQDAQQQEQRKRNQLQMEFNISKEEFLTRQNFQIKALEAQQASIEAQREAQQDQIFAASVLDMYKDIPMEEKMVMMHMNATQLKDYLQMRNDYFAESEVELESHKMDDGSIAFFNKQWQVVTSYSPYGSYTETGGMSWLDARPSADQFPNQARAKNNNPAGITRSESFSKQLKEAGIPHKKGTPRPANEWGNYIMFDDMATGFEAYMFSVKNNHWHRTVSEFLQKWKWVGDTQEYAESIAWVAWVSLTAKVNDLDDASFNNLIMAQVERESPSLYWFVKDNAGWLEPWSIPYNKRYSQGNQKLLDDMKSINKDSGFSEVQSSYFKMEAVWNRYLSEWISTEGGKWPMDQTLITVFNKMLDPWSVVREGEYDRTSQGAAVISRAEALLQTIQQGGASITDEMRQEMVEVANTLYNQSIVWYNIRRQRFYDIAKYVAADPNLVNQYMPPISSYTARGWSIAAQVRDNVQEDEVDATSYLP